MQKFSILLKKMHYENSLKSSTMLKVIKKKNMKTVKEIATKHVNI